MAQQMQLDPWVQELVDQWVLSPLEAARLQLQWDEMPQGQMLWLPPRAALFKMPPANRLPL